MMRTDPAPEPGDLARAPFSNSTQWEYWAAANCSSGQGCIHDSTYGQADEELGTEVHCPLITLALQHIWPREWPQGDLGPGACAAYADDLPEPAEPPVIAVDLFDTFAEEPRS